jgi:glutaconate CoA-transferase subunit A
MMVTGVVHAPGGAHFTSCTPDYERDERFQKAYATAAKDEGTWREFTDRFLGGSEQDYQDAVTAWHADSEGSR